MTKYDFRKIQVADVEGNVKELDFSKHLGNYMYINASHIKEAELGKKIYNDGEVEIERGMEDLVVKMAKDSGLLFPVWSAIENALK